MSAVADLRRRSAQAELMDGESLSFAEFHDCLRQLERINVLTLAYRPTLRWLRRVLRRLPSGETLELLDAGSGGGDMLRRIEALARREGRAVRLRGVDLEPLSRRCAELSSPGSCIRFETADIFTLASEPPCDLVVSSLFTHHLNEEEVLHFLRWMDRRTRRGWFINDLHRRHLPYYFILAATRLFSRNRLIRHDAAVSVARSFRPADWRRLLDQAGVSGRIRIRRHFPYRLCVSCEKGPLAASGEEEPCAAKRR